MSSAFDFWPFNIGPTEGWAVLYLLMAGGVMWISSRIADVVGAAADRKAMAEADAAAALAIDETAGDAYRTPGKVTSHRMGIGTLPKDDDVWRIAFLRKGVLGIAELVASLVVTDGYIVADGTKLKRGKQTIDEGAHPIVRDLVYSLGGNDEIQPTTLWEKAKDVAFRHQVEIANQLEALSFTRSPSLVTKLRAITLVGGVVAIALGIIRIGVRQAVKTPIRRSILVTSRRWKGSGSFRCG